MMLKRKFYERETVTVAKQLLGKQLTKKVGKTETIIGNWLKERNCREKIILATKISGPGPSWIRGGGLQYTKKNILV